MYARESILASKLTADQQGFVSTIVIIEIVWVLLSRYRYSRALVRDALLQLLQLPHLRVERDIAVRRAIASFRTSKADFADCLIAQLSLAAGCEYTLTFNQDAAQLPGMRLLS